MSMLVSLDTWRALGGFDEEFFPAMGVDWDFSTAAWEAGFIVLCEPSSVVRHRSGAMVDEGRGPLASRPFRRFLKERAVARFRRKWGHVLRNCALPTTPDGDGTQANAVRRELARLEARARAIAARSRLQQSHSVHRWIARMQEVQATSTRPSFAWVDEETQRRALERMFSVQSSSPSSPLIRHCRTRPKMSCCVGSKGQSESARAC